MVVFLLFQHSRSPFLPWGLQKVLFKGGHLLLDSNEWIRRRKGKAILGKVTRRQSLSSSALEVPGECYKVNMPEQMVTDVPSRLLVESRKRSLGMLCWQYSRIGFSCGAETAFRLGQSASGHP
jgi:hypothetical protein